MGVKFRCWAEVDLDALRENLAWIRHRVGPDVKIMTVVKADAYGHGLKEIAALLMQSGTDIFGVANPGEAQAIRSVGKGWPILMLGACLPDEVDAAVRDDMMPTISSMREAQLFSEAAVRRKRSLSVHVKVDTGMGRLGASPEQTPELLRAVGTLPNLSVAGLYTHYSSAEEDAGFSRKQRVRFQKLVKELQKEGLCPSLIHANNSAGLLHETSSFYNLVRPGLLVFGIVPPGNRRSSARLSREMKPALSFKCRVGFIKEVPAGTALSYGGTYVTKRRMRIATLTAGYGDGYLRAGSNRAQVLVGGRRCPVLGRITMDQMLVDVSAIDAVEVGDEAVLIGRQGTDGITAAELAQWCQSIPWEVLTAITYRVPRIYRGGHAS